MKGIVMAFTTQSIMCKTDGGGCSLMPLGPKLFQCTMCKTKYKWNVHSERYEETCNLKHK